MHRIASLEQQQRRRRVSQAAEQVDAMQFFNVLTSDELLEVTEAQLPAHRERLYPPTVTLSMFMMQALQDDSSCQRAVNDWSVRRMLEGLSVPGLSSGAYCKARRRLPTPMITALLRHTGSRLSELALPQWRWRNRTVKLVDGTTLSMPDTKDNQAQYPQSSNQASGVGFPLSRVVAVMCLATGTVCDAAMGPCSGPGGSELALLRQLYSSFKSGDIVLGDALYCNYFVLAQLLDLNVDAVFEQQGGRITDFRRGTHLSARDHIVHWKKPRRSEWMTQAQYASLPETLTLRETRIDGRVLVTTMTDHRAVNKHALKQLYQRRWQVELNLRDLKSTLKMDILRCQTSAMNQKQMYVTLLAYNLIRLLMAQAASHEQLKPCNLSFKHTLQLWNSAIPHYESIDLVALLELIAARTVGHRPERHEPRARKRRPKPYPLLQVPRKTARKSLAANRLSA